MEGYKGLKDIHSYFDEPLDQGWSGLVQHSQGLDDMIRSNGGNRGRHN
jgi:hypothetical protein